MGLSLFFPRGVASTLETALCTNRAGAKSAKYRNYEQETISLEEEDTLLPLMMGHQRTRCHAR
jgi:hypothetical protein